MAPPPTSGWYLATPFDTEGRAWVKWKPRKMFYFADTGQWSLCGKRDQCTLTVIEWEKISNGDQSQPH